MGRNTNLKLVEPEQPDISRALAIPGFMGLGQLEWLAWHAAQHERIVEVGSFMGRSTRALADNTPGLVFALDNWQGPWEMDLPMEIRRDLFDTFKTNLADHIAAGKVIAIKGDHALAPRGIQPDMVFIDGDHNMGSVVRDLTFWRQEITPGGLLCGDDYDFPSVSEALRMVLGKVEVTENIWSVYVG